MRLSPLDLAIIAVYLIGITLFGLRFRSRQRTMRDYFLADRNIPWWAIALSIVAAETSTLTIISIPGLAYDSNLAFLQLVLGYVVGRIIISFILLPQYFRGELYTAYQLIERRFGPDLRTVTAGLFLLTRAAAEGVRVYAVSIVVSIALGTGEIASIAIITLLTLIYTFEGGLAAVIWTDVVQTFIYVGGTLVGLVTILHLVPGGWAAAQSTAGELHKFQMIDFSMLFSKPYTLWAGIIGGAFLRTASHGTDQLIVQRLLAAKNERQSVLALLSSAFAVFLPVRIISLCWRDAVCILPSAFIDFWTGRQNLSHLHRQPHAAWHSGTPDRCYFSGGDVEPERGTEFPVVEFDDGFLCSFSSRLIDDTKRLRLARIATVAWALVLFALATPRAASSRPRRRSRFANRLGRVWSSAWSISVGCAHADAPNQRGAIIGMLCGFGAELYLWQWSHVAFTWWVAIGTCATFIVGYAASLLFVSQQTSIELPMRHAMEIRDH